jgi:FkbM family methyltransferase
VLKKIRNKLKNLLANKNSVDKEYILNTYSQVGEDSIISFLFADKEVGEITYLDLGTNMPDVSNNTYLFYTRGFRGVCVEADKSLIQSISRKRPEDIIINAGVSTLNETEADFYIFNVNGLNTFDKDEAQRRSTLQGYNVIEIVKVPIISINTILENNFKTYPTLLSIDIEGLDFDVLNAIDYLKYPIPVICVETCKFSSNYIRPKDFSINNLLVSKGYESYADTYVNTIFVNKNWFYNLKDLQRRKIFLIS